jgi:putative FmdB family regulatory protein
MPLFEFTCRGCGHKFETLIIGNRQAVCPTCASADLEKLYSTFAAGGSTETSGRSGAASRFT